MLKGVLPLRIMTAAGVVGYPVRVGALLRNTRLHREATGRAAISPPATGSSPPRLRIRRSSARVIWISRTSSAASRAVRYLPSGPGSIPGIPRPFYHHPRSPLSRCLGSIRLSSCQSQIRSAADIRGQRFAISDRHDPRTGSCVWVTSSPNWAGACEMVQRIGESRVVRFERLGGECCTTRPICP